jgi:hypothetical protein
MAEIIYQESNFRFTDPIRTFKANDPYYFEVDNIPLKQLQENCLWLKDQIREVTQQRITNIVRADLEELRPYASGGDRKLKVKPGRFTARINDASTKSPLAYLEKVVGDALGEMDEWATALPNPGTFPNDKNAVLQTALNQFKSMMSQDALGMTGLVERAFTWPVVTPEAPVDHDGVVVNTAGGLSYGDADSNTYGSGARYNPMVISQALVWAESNLDATDRTYLFSFATEDEAVGFSKFPRTENYFIKRWRGVSRTAIVDIPSELEVEIPSFDPEDFSYIGADGTVTPVTGVQSRIDLVFIYSKPVDASGVNILTSSSKQKITKPQLGVVRGAGIRANFQDSTVPDFDYLSNTGEDHKILASPGDQSNANMGFTAASGNDIAFDVRGSFPAPDDILNLAPLISEKLEDEAYELIGQSILPVAYVWVQAGSEVVLASDVIDIRPFFRTAELAYNERAGIAAAFPQLSLANPAVGKSQLDYESRRLYTEFNNRLISLEGGEQAVVQKNMVNLATGYVFGGWNFGPEGAMYNYYQTDLLGEGSDVDTGGNDDLYLKTYVTNKYGYGSDSAQLTIPAYPDWDLATWCTLQDINNKGLFPNDYINTFFNIAQGNVNNFDAKDPSIIAGSYSEMVNIDGTNADGNVSPAKLQNFRNMEANVLGGLQSTVNFHYVKKRILFDRDSLPWLADYKVDVDLINSLPQNDAGVLGDSLGEGRGSRSGSYFGHWVEKGWNEFTIYVAFIADSNNYRTENENPRFPAPHSLSYTTSTKKKKTTQTLTVSQRGGERFSGFIVPVQDMLQANTNPLSNTNGLGYIGNPRVGKCTYPTVMFNIQGVPVNNAAFLYGNLNGTDPLITLQHT